MLTGVKHSSRLQKARANPPAGTDRVCHPGGVVSAVGGWDRSTLAGQEGDALRARFPRLRAWVKGYIFAAGGYRTQGPIGL